MSNHDLAGAKQQSPKKEKHKATRRQKYLMLSGATTFLIVVALVLINVLTIYITDRTVIFQLVEAAHYRINPQPKAEPKKEAGKGNRTLSLIDNFLDSMPKEEDEDKKEKKKRRPTPADAAVDYVAYLLESEEENDNQGDAEPLQLKGQQLIDSFIENDKGKIVLNETPQFTPEIENNDSHPGSDSDEGYFTETLARIYIKQGRYSKALEIIQRLSLNYPKKNAYFADQIRFLNKLIINNNKK